MTQQQQQHADHRNLHWKSNNVGSKLMAKLGWKEGEAVGKRQRQRQPQTQDDDGHVNHDRSLATTTGTTTTTTTSTTTTAASSTSTTTTNTFTTEGIRMKKRPDGLGLGAPNNDSRNHNALWTRTAAGNNDYHANFCSLLEQLQQEHNDSNSSSKGDRCLNKEQKKKRKKKENKKDRNNNTKNDETNDLSLLSSSTLASVLVLPTNRLTHAKVRQAKFQAKSAHDLKCIFGGGGGGNGGGGGDSENQTSTASVTTSSLLPSLPTLTNAPDNNNDETNTCDSFPARSKDLDRQDRKRTWIETSTSGNDHESCAKQCNSSSNNASSKASKTTNKKRKKHES